MGNFVGDVLMGNFVGDFLMGDFFGGSSIPSERYPRRTSFPVFVRACMRCFNGEFCGRCFNGKFCGRCFDGGT